MCSSSYYAVSSPRKRCSESLLDVILLQLGNWLLVEQVCSVEIFCFRFTSQYLSYVGNILYVGLWSYLYSAEKVWDLFCFIFRNWMFCCSLYSVWLRCVVICFGSAFHEICKIWDSNSGVGEEWSLVMLCRVNSWPMFRRIFVSSSSGSGSSRSLPYVDGTPFFVATTLCYSECRDSLSALRGVIVADCLGFLHFPKTYAGVGR